MRALITGGAGFIGSHLAEELLEAGYQVHVIDDLTTGRIENLDQIRNTDGFTIPDSIAGEMSAIMESLKARG